MTAVIASLVCWIRGHQYASVKLSRHPGQRIEQCRRCELLRKVAP